MSIVFREAVDFLKRRLALSPSVFNEIVKAMDEAATDRAAGMRDALVRDITEAVAKALEEGTTAEDFRDRFDTLTKTHGWTGDNSEGWRSALTFRTMTAQAVAAGRWEQIQRLKKSRPFLRYITAGDHRVREAHKQWHNLVLHCDDPWWSTHFPPNGFNCRCHVMQLSDRDLKRYGLTVSEEAPPLDLVPKIVRLPDGTREAIDVPRGIDPGFAYNPGVAGLKLFGPEGPPSP